MKRFFIFFLLVIAAFLLISIYINTKEITMPQIPIPSVYMPSQKPTPSPFYKPMPIPTAKMLQTNYHVFQSFNNCGPAAMSMALSHYGITESQETLGQALRPYQNPQGDNDDKSVTLEELAEKSKEYDLVPYHRPGGTIEIMENFIAADMPVITRTWLKPDEDIGHYRVVKGYDQTARSIIQDDSLQNKNLWYTYDEFNTIWEKFNYEFLVLVPQDKVEIANAILGENANEEIAWKNALLSAQEKLQQEPNNIYAKFNVSLALYHNKQYQESINEYEQIKDLLPSRTLWYQIEPILAYKELKQYDTVLNIISQILNNHNRAYAELYVIRGDIYKEQGNIEGARQEYETALFYNRNLKAAQDKLEM